MSEETGQEFPRYDNDGYVVVRNLLTSQEVTKLLSNVEQSRTINKYKYGRNDGEGGCVKLALWTNTGNDVTGAVARSEKVAGRMEQLLGGEVYHYHSKLIMKDAKTGGAHAWHQDYGYWYENGFLFPDMGTVFVALDKADKENGCLQVLRGSHKAGRVTHVKVGDQVGADLERVQELSKVLELVHLELDPGDACFFHSNLLHRSDQNHSGRRRWAYLVAYNRCSNPPAGTPEQHPPIVKVPNSAILQCSDDPDETDNSAMNFVTASKPLESVGSIGKRDMRAVT